MSGLLRAFWRSRGKHVRSPFAASRDQIHHRLRFCCDSFLTWIFLRSFRHHFRTIGRTEMANIEQAQQMIPLITREMSFGQNVSELVFGVNVFDLDLGVQKWFYRITNQEQLCGFWKHVSLSASSLDNHLDHCFVVFKHIQQSFLMRRIDVWVNKINIVQSIDHFLRLLSFLNCVRCWTNFTSVH